MPRDRLSQILTKLLYPILAFIALTMNSCLYSDEKATKDLTVYSYDKMKYALAIKYRTEGRGNIHTFDFSKYELDDADWIYTNRIKGQITSDSIIFTHYQDELEYPWSQSNLKGTVTFDSLSVKIELMMPEYDDGVNISRWVPYKFNGEYKLTLSTERPPIIDKKP